MKLKNIKHIIDAYFDALRPMELVHHLETLGYEFEPLDESVYFPQPNTVADFSEVYSNINFEGIFFEGVFEDVLYANKKLTQQPLLTDCSENYQYAMAA